MVITGHCKCRKCESIVKHLNLDHATTGMLPTVFLRRQQVLQLYRKILRTIRQIPNEADRRYMRDWAREDFKRNKEATDEDTVKMMITQGNLQLQELERTLKLAKS